HNYDDLIHMLDIIQILDILKEKKSFSINYKQDNKEFTINNIKFVGDMINITGNIDSPLDNDLKHYDHGYSLITDKGSNFLLSMEYGEGYISEQEKCIFIDLAALPYFTLIDETNYTIP